MSTPAHSAIWLTWLIITTTAIPVAISHGVLNYPYEGHVYTTCMFLSSMGYNLRAFQVENPMTNRMAYRQLCT